MLAHIPACCCLSVQFEKHQVVFGQSWLTFGESVAGALLSFRHENDALRAKPFPVPEGKWERDWIWLEASPLEAFLD